MSEAASSQLPLNPEDYAAAEALERGRKLFARECRFFWGAARIDNLPPAGQPEVSFAGRSNVGKSSLLNALVGHKALARASQTPGRTRELNFFDLGGALTLVDLPGYGYAKAPKHRIADWTELLQAYLRGRQTLARLCLLVDSRHGLKPVDHQLMELLNRTAVTFQIVLTKSDKVAARDLVKVGDSVLAEGQRYAACYPAVVATSAETGDGIPLLRSFLAGLAEHNA